MSSDEEQEKLKKELAQRLNPNITTGIRGLSFNERKSLQLSPPQLVLPPYTSDPAYLMPENEMEIKGQPISSSTTTTFEGRRAQVISFVINQPITLRPNSEYAYPINRFEDGEITHFTVAMNDPDMRVVLTLYDDNQRPDPMCNESVNELILLGRGLSHGQAIVTDVDTVSVDWKGEHHTVLPYVLRYKHTFSYGFKDPDDYDKVAGTSNDKWFVIEYEPTLPAPYKKIYFTIQNPTNNPRIIHSARIRRYAFLDSFSQAVPAGDQNASNLPLTQSLLSGGMGRIAQTARKSRLIA